MKQQLQKISIEGETIFIEIKVTTTCIIKPDINKQIRDAEFLEDPLIRGAKVQPVSLQRPTPSDVFYMFALNKF